MFKNIWHKGFFHVFVANITFAIVAFGSQLFVAKFLTEEELGYIKIFQTFIQIAGVIAGFGLSTSVLILCGNIKYENFKNEIFHVALRLVIFTALGIWCLFMILNKFGIWSSIENVQELFYLYSIILALNAIISVYTAYFQAARIFKTYALLMVSTKVTSLLLMVALTFFYGINGFMIGLLSGLVLSLITNIVFYLKYFNGTISIEFKNFKSIAKNHFSTGIHGLGANLFGQLTTNMDIILLSYLYFDNPKLIGQYSFAAIFITGLSMIQGTVVQVSTPYFSKYTASKQATNELFKKYNLLLLGASLVILLGMYLLFPIFNEFVYEDKFFEGGLILQVLIFVWFFRCLNGINIAYLLASNNTKTTNIINFVTSLISATAILVCLKYYSIEYMLYMLIIISFATYIITRSICKTKLRIQPSKSK